MHIIIGLGNPGREYHRTRHNVGFDVIDVLCEKLGIQLTRSAMHGLIGEGFIGGEKVLLVKPQTFMNLSGQCVTELVSFYKPELENVMVIFDDIDLPLGGRVRFFVKNSGIKIRTFHHIQRERPIMAFPHMAFTGYFGNHSGDF